MGAHRLPTRLVDLCVHGPLCGSWRYAGEMGGSREASADTRLGSRCLESPHRRIRNRLELWLAVCRASGSRRRGGGLRSGVQLAYRRFVSRCPARPRPRVLHARASIGRFSRNLRERTCSSSIWLAHGFLPRLRSRAASYDTHSAVARSGAWSGGEFATNRTARRALIFLGIVLGGLEDSEHSLDCRHRRAVQRQYVHHRSVLARLSPSVSRAGTEAVHDHRCNPLWSKRCPRTTAGRLGRGSCGHGPREWTAACLRCVVDSEGLLDFFSAEPWSGTDSTFCCAYDGGLHGWLRLLRLRLCHYPGRRPSQPSWHGHGHLFSRHVRPRGKLRSRVRRETQRLFCNASHGRVWRERAERAFSRGGIAWGHVHDSRVQRASRGVCALRGSHRSTGYERVARADVSFRES